MSDDEKPLSRKRAVEELFEDGEDDTKENFESEDEVVDEDGNVAGDLDLSKGNTQAWLVKVPKFLADSWTSVNEDGVMLGTVRIFSQPPPGEAPFQLLLPNNERTVNLPKAYTLNMNPHQVTNTFVFTEPLGPHPRAPQQGGYPTGKATSIMATVKHECAVTPLPGSKEYREIMRERNIEAAKKGGRSVQIIGDNGRADPLVARGGMFLPGQGARKEFIQKKAKVQMDQKTTRMPKNELMDLLFAAFEQFPYWSFKGLVEYCKQPQSYLKEVLNEICNFIKKGPYTAKYQLKPEFIRKSPGSSSAVAAAGDETTFNPAAVGVGKGENPAAPASAAEAEDIDDDEEDFDEDDEEFSEVQV